MLTKKEQTAHDATLKRERGDREKSAKAQQERRAKRSAKRAETKR